MQMTCNFGLQNTRIKGYPADFYALPFTLLDPFEKAMSNENLKAIGFNPIDWKMAVKCSDENTLT